MLKSMPLNQTNRSVDCVLYWRDRDDGGGLLLNPPYQRGDVWGRKRRVNLIRSILLGVPIPSIIINDRLGADWKDDYRIVVIDGKQRITTLLMFFDGKLSVPGEWFGVDSESVTYLELPRVQQRGFCNRAVPFSEGRLKSLDAEREVFDLVNYGGLAQGEVDIEELDQNEKGGGDADTSER